MSDELPHLNEEMISELREIMADDFKLLISTYINDTVGRIEEIEQILQANDAKEFAKACHSLKGSSTNVGVLKLADLCRQGERRGNEDDLDGAAELLNQINAEFKLVSNLLTAI